MGHTRARSRAHDSLRAMQEPGPGWAAPGASACAMGTIRARSAACGASTPRYRTRCMRGGGSNAASRRMNSSGSNTGWVGPSSQAVPRAKARWPSSTCRRRRLDGDLVPSLDAAGMCAQGCLTRTTALTQAFEIPIHPVVASMRGFVCRRNTNSASDLRARCRERPGRSRLRQRFLGRGLRRQHLRGRRRLHLRRRRGEPAHSGFCAMIVPRTSAVGSRLALRARRGCDAGCRSAGAGTRPPCAAWAPSVPRDVALMSIHRR